MVRNSGTEPSSFYEADVCVSPSPAECIYKRRWLPRAATIGGKPARPTSDSHGVAPGSEQSKRTAEDDAKLIFGTVFSLRNMVRKLGGEDDR